MTERDNTLDILKGLLIISVVLGHCGVEYIHNFVFLFHMPLFFILSGYLLKRERMVKSGYVWRKVRNLMIPYFVYLGIDILLIRKTYTHDDILYALWGGRALSGTYWYITCYLFALAVFCLYLRHLTDRMIKILILIGGVAAVVESNIIDGIPKLQRPGIPWNIDVSLLALVYIGVGFFGKRWIRNVIEDRSPRYDLAAGGIMAVLAVFCWYIYRGGEPVYSFDMKPVYYRELVSAVLVPCLFGFVIVRLVHWMVRINVVKMLNRFLALCGRASLPIMFMHVPLNFWRKDLGYGVLAYVLIGICVPVAFTLIFNRWSFARTLFGLPSIELDKK